MGTYYIIAAGGTGAMCARSFIYMAAAGCADNNSTYHILLVDKDKESDAVTACENLLADYEAMRNQLGSEPGTFTFPEICFHKWNFTDEILDEYRKQTGKSAEDMKHLTLKKLLNPDLDPQITQLLATMYTQDELEVDLNQGFYGHPNIGAPVFDYVRDRFLSPKWVNANGQTVVNTFMDSLHNSLKNDKTHVYLFGSLFGGTGATVIPNVVLALRSIYDKTAGPVGKTHLILGGSVIMPYFKLPDPDANSLAAIKKIIPASNKFEGQTREALEYYHESGLLSNLMNLMLLGTSNLDVTSEMFAPGGSQTQHFHMVLLLAATAATRFFRNELGEKMATAVKADDKVEPQGELLVWKVTTAGPNYDSLTPSELGLDWEYKKLTAFLRFSVVVGYYMRLKFNKTADDLKVQTEVQGTAKRFNLNPKQLTTIQMDTYYKEPVAKAGAICKGFINFMYDIALSGYDWSKYRFHIPQHAQQNGSAYFNYTLGAVDPKAAAGFSSRWVDFGNLSSLKQLLETETPDQVINNMTLNQILSYPMKDAGRPDYQENRYPNSIATVYEDSMKGALGLERNWLGGMKNDQRQFCEIYDQLMKLCD